MILSKKQKKIMKILEILKIDANLTLKELNKRTGFPITSIYGYILEIMQEYDFKTILVPKKMKK